LVIVSFGGPEGPDDVLPFLRNVVSGRDVPDARLREVAENYERFGGVSPLNRHNRALVAAVSDDLAAHGLAMPVYLGNRNWHPFLTETVASMGADGVRRALAFVTSAYGSWSSCGQYLSDIAEARLQAGGTAPRIDKLRLFHNHPGFIEPLTEALDAARRRVGPDAPVLFSAHSIPTSMAASCGYERQLRDTAELVASRADRPPPTWSLVYQSRSGPPGQDWLEPDILAVLGSERLGADRVVVAPIGFVSDHMEVVYDLDVQARAAAAARGVELVRAATPGLHPRFVHMVSELVVERVHPGTPRLALGPLGVPPDDCSPGCCPPPVRGRRAGTAG
jgi:ferrochelatase